MTHKEAVAKVGRDLRRLGYKVVTQTHSAAKGPDIEVWTGKKGYKVEVKIPKKLVNGGYQIDPLQEKNADMVAMVLPNGRIIYSSYKDHVKAASKKGFRGTSDYVNFFRGV